MLKQIMFREYVMIAVRDGRVPPIYLYFVMILIGFAYVYGYTGLFNYTLFLTLFVSYGLLLASVNLFDDYFDYTNGIDKPESPNTLYRKHPIYYYNKKPSILLHLGIVASSVSFAMIALFSVLAGKYLLLIFGAAGVIVAYGYTGPPFGFKYRKLGEAVLMISFILIFMSIVYSETGTLYTYYDVLSFPFALLLFVLLLIGDFRDIDDDRGKIETISTAIGKRKTIILMESITFTSLGLVALYGIFKLTKPYSLVALITAPIFLIFFYRIPGISKANLENRYGQIISLYGLLVILSVIL